MPDTSWIAGGHERHAGPSRFDQALAWIKKNRETFIGSVVIIIAIIIFAVYFFLHYRGLRETAWKTLFVAQQTGFGGNVEEAKAQLDTIQASFGSTSAAQYAMITKGDILFAQGRYKEAGDEYSKALNSKDAGPFALYNLGKCKEADGDLTGAQAQYSDFLSRYPEHFIAPEVHVSLARAQEIAGASDLARGSYERIALLYPDTAWAEMAKARTGQAPKK